MTRHLNTADLAYDFGDRWGYQAPTSGRLRTAFSDGWVRFHSFANLQRYPPDAADIRQAHRRHRRVLQDVRRAHGRGRLIFVTAGAGPWEALAEDGSAFILDRKPRTVPGLVEWFNAPSDVPTYPYLRVYGSASVTARQFDRLLGDIILGAPVSVTVADASMNWLYRPYDGGADVVLPTKTDRDRLARRYAGWVSPLPSRLWTRPAHPPEARWRCNACCANMVPFSVTTASSKTSPMVSRTQNLARKTAHGSSC
jgi:hypothetical protein